MLSFTPFKHQMLVLLCQTTAFPTSISWIILAFKTFKYGVNVAKLVFMLPNLTFAVPNLVFTTPKRGSLKCQKSLGSTLKIQNWTWPNINLQDLDQNLRLTTVTSTPMQRRCSWYRLLHNNATSDHNWHRQIEEFLRGWWFHCSLFWRRGRRCRSCRVEGRQCRSRGTC